MSESLYMQGIDNNLDFRILTINERFDSFIFVKSSSRRYLLSMDDIDCIYLIFSNMLRRLRHWE